ncbi:uncharacterized protein LOC125212908 [Salvia hispanica]|uniref:uncharacterized protein LOC125212908 n=1 Tax=Salvia hispanica TaxID=49212 RepID=UPI002009018E|nr:uncharacterized protein LOC125212908 [Salvia hispanica]
MVSSRSRSRSRSSAAAVILVSRRSVNGDRAAEPNDGDGEVDPPPAVAVPTHAENIAKATEKVAEARAALEAAKVANDPAITCASETTTFTAGAVAIMLLTANLDVIQRKVPIAAHCALAEKRVRDAAFGVHVGVTAARDKIDEARAAANAASNALDGIFNVDASPDPHLAAYLGIAFDPTVIDPSPAEVEEGSLIAQSVEDIEKDAEDLTRDVNDLNNMVAINVNMATLAADTALTIAATSIAATAAVRITHAPIRAHDGVVEARNAVVQNLGTSEVFRAVMAYAAAVATAEAADEEIG